MMFPNRDIAAKMLLEDLNEYKGHKNLVVAGIPRGAMPMAKIIADGLGAEITAVLVHKIPSPDSVEFAIGSVGLSGNIHRASYVGRYGISDDYIEEEAKRQLQMLKLRQKRYGLTKPDYHGKTVIIVDDGIATGATTIAAIREVRSYSPDKVVLATPVSSVEAAAEIRPMVDDVHILYVPSIMFSIGEFYEYFPQVSDSEVISVLQERGGPHELEHDSDRP